MQPKIYHPDRIINTTKPVQLDMQTDDGNVVIVAVDEHGRSIAQLIVFMENEVIAVHHAKEVLESSGYDTTFAEWDARTDAMIVASI